MTQTSKRHVAANEIESMISSVEKSAKVAVKNLKHIASHYSAIEVLQFIKFNQIGANPLAKNEKWNLIEQVNQTFTYLASLKAAKYLFAKHKKLLSNQSLVLNLGTASGSDIYSEDGKIIAEVFAATDPQNNQKLKKAIPEK